MADPDLFDFSAEAHAKRLPEEGWHHAIVHGLHISETDDATWISLSLELDTGHRVDDVVCVGATADGKFASRVHDGRRRLHMYLKAGNCPTKLSQRAEMEAVLIGAEIDVEIRWRNPDFPVPSVRDVREPTKEPQNS